MPDLPNSTVFAAQDGDEAACREILEALHRPVIATIFRFLGPRFRHEVEDIAQDVFLKVFRAIGQFDPSRARFTTWVYTLVRNHCYDVLKKRRVPTVALAGEDDAPAHEPQDDREQAPTAGAENEELGQQIGQALAALGEDQRMVFILREYEGLDYAEIAAATGVSEGTVKSRLFRAKAAMRARLLPYLRTGS